MVHYGVLCTVYYKAVHKTVLLFCSTVCTGLVFTSNNIIHNLKIIVIAGAVIYNTYLF